MAAEIIAFPQPQPSPEEPGERLRKAMAALDVALKAQSEAMAQWRGSLGSLRGSVDRLGNSLHGFDGQLASLRATVEHVNGEAHRLEAWADAALEPTPG